MPIPFLGSGDYDERAHDLYDSGDYGGALRTLKEGLERYPKAAELRVGLGYTRLAREEFVWAKHAFERALAIEPGHADALVGLGATVLRFGRRDRALALFERALDAAGPSARVELLLSSGYALYRAGLFEDAHETFRRAARTGPRDPEPSAALGYTLHRLGREGAARSALRDALERDPAFHEARVYLGHLLYDRGEWADALAEFERVPPREQRDPLALRRLIELKGVLCGLEPGAAELAPWEERHDRLAAAPDPVDGLLAELERRGRGSVGGLDR